MSRMLVVLATRGGHGEGSGGEGEGGGVESIDLSMIHHVGRGGGRGGWGVLRHWSTNL